MKNKGFTLIELLVVLAVMALLSTIVTVSLTSSLKNAHQKECDEFITEIENAACVYVEMSDKEVVCTRTNCAPIKLNYLIRAGLVKNETDMCTGKSVNSNETVTITWDDTGEKHCEYNGVKVYER